ncbi:MAG: hypothetical protein JNL12_15520 [Planctomycetes bacterium]|nr:hypothetical protein [Planctomycetota bacterium]
MRSLRFVYSLILFTLPGLAQSAPSVAEPTFGVTAGAGQPRAHGPDYAARFAADGAVFLPHAAGREAEADGLHLAMRSMQRGEGPVWNPVVRPLPVVHGDEVHYVHADGPTEIYRSRPDGVELRFVFAERPAGEGDLVVTVAVATRLPLVAANDDGAHFHRANGPGIHVGGVTGIDATGLEVRGGLRAGEGTLELRLPASFVDNAAYPMVLDPLIGSSFLVGNDIGYEATPSVAYDAATGRYLVVWMQQWSGSHPDVVGQLVRDDGVLVGPRFVIESTGYLGIRPVVVNITDSDRFLVVWASDDGTTGIGPIPGTGPWPVLKFAAVSAGTGAVSATQALWGVLLSDAPNGVAAGGDSRTPVFGNADRALVVWTGKLGSSTGYARRCQIQVPPTGNPTIVGGAVTTIFSQVGTTVREPAVSKHGGSLGRWLVAFAWGSGSTTTNLSAAFYDGSGNACGGTQFSFGATVGHPATATRDGSQFLLAWEDPSGDVSVRPCTWTGTCASGSAAWGATIPGLAPNSSQPELDCARDKFMLVTQSGGLGLTQVRSLLLQDGSLASAVATAGQTPLTSSDGLAVASRWSGGDGSSDEALVVQVGSTGGNGIYASRCEATGTGTVTNLGGACGIPGFSDLASYTGSPVIGTTFTIDLVGPTAPIAALIIGFSASPLACGPCTAVPSLDAIVTGVPSSVSITVPLQPSLVGASLLAQWVQVRPSGCPLMPDLGLSNALQFTISD